MKAAKWAGVACAAVFLAAGIGAPQPAADEPPVESGVAKIRRDAGALKGVVKTELSRRFLDQAEYLPTIAPRTVYRDEAGKQWLSKGDVEALSEEVRGALKPRVIEEETYYYTKYGSPLAYSRALEVWANSGAVPGAKAVSAKRILDFGYGGIGHLRMLAAMGADVVGVDVDTFLRAIYSEPNDQGAVKARTGGRDGSVKLVHGFFPAGEGMKEAVGTGFDLFVSKNTLKKGYIHPARTTDPARLVQLGVDDATFVKVLYDILKPGGVVLIYNLCPAPSKPEEEYLPWSDGRCPFDREVIEAAGFKVVAFDEVDDGGARELGRVLQWDKGGMDLEKNLFAHYTIFQKPSREQPAR